MFSASKTCHPTPAASSSKATKHQRWLQQHRSREKSGLRNVPITEMSKYPRPNWKTNKRKPASCVLLPPILPEMRAAPPKRLSRTQALRFGRRQDIGHAGQLHPGEGGCNCAQCFAHLPRVSDLSGSLPFIFHRMGRLIILL